MIVIPVVEGNCIIMNLPKFIKKPTYSSAISYISLICRVMGKYENYSINVTFKEPEIQGFVLYNENHIEFVHNLDTTEIQEFDMYN